jgi:hypothetical protein
MYTLSQWLHQHDFLLLVILLLAGSLFVLLWFRLWTRRTAVVWGGFLVLAVAVLVGLRTSAAIESEILAGPEFVNVSNKNVAANSVNTTEERFPNFFSTEDITTYLQNRDKPTLVEFYSDFGMG